MDLLLIRIGELTLKSDRIRRRLKKKLIYNALEALGDLTMSYEEEPGRLYFYVKDLEEASKRLQRVFGIVGIAKARLYELRSPSNSSLQEVAKRISEEIDIEEPFAVRVRRVGDHEFTSVDAAKIIGAEIHARGLSVDLKNPKTEIFVEIRRDRVYVYTEELPGPGGLPLGTEGSAIALISGGIDSPVAARYTMRRGVLTHFLHGLPVDDDSYLERVKEIVEILRSWSIGESPRFFVADLREFVEEASRRYRPMITILVKRRLIRIAESLSERLDAKAIVLGDSIGQVASQTLRNMYAIDYNARLSIIRPLAGFDKREIMEKAAYIGTYEISKRHEERASRYARRHVRTKASIDDVLEAERNLERIESPIILESRSSDELRGIS